MNQSQPKPIAYFQWLRLLAAAAVVLMHTAGKQWSAISCETAEWAVLTIYDGFVRWPVPVFLMITGALFLPRATSMKTILTRYIPRMALAFVLWSGVYALLTYWRGASAEAALLKFVGGEYHLWYLPFLCGVYLALPFVQKIVTDERLGDQLLLTAMVVALAIPWLADLVTALLPAASGIVRSLENSLHYTFFFDHLSLLLLGHYLHRRELSPACRRTLYVLGLLGAILTGPATIWISRRTGLQSSLFFDHAAPGTLLAAAAIFVFAKHNLTKLPKAVDLLARLSFGVYLSHVLILEILAISGIQALTCNPVWFVPTLAAAVFILAALTSWILGKLPLVGRFLA